MQISHAQVKHSKDPWQSLRGQTVHSVPCKRILQQAQIRFVAESATLLFFFDLLCCFWFHKQIPKTLYRSSSLQNLHLRIPLGVAESRTTSYICLLRNPQQVNCADKNYIASICTRNPREYCKWNPLTFWNMFKYLSLESRNIQTQNCAPIQCTNGLVMRLKSFFFPILF